MLLPHISASRDATRGPVTSDSWCGSTSHVMITGRLRMYRSSKISNRRSCVHVDGRAAARSSMNSRSTLCSCFDKVRPSPSGASGRSASNSAVDRNVLITGEPCHGWPGPYWASSQRRHVFHAVCVLPTPIAPVKNRDRPPQPATQSCTCCGRSIGRR